MTLGLFIVLLLMAQVVKLPSLLYGVSSTCVLIDSFSDSFSISPLLPPTARSSWLYLQISNMTLWHEWMNECPLSDCLYQQSNRLAYISPFFFRFIPLVVNTTTVGTTAATATRATSETAACTASASTDGHTATCIAGRGRRIEGAAGAGTSGQSWD